MTKGAPLGALVALGLGALALRPQIVGIAPLFPEIEHDLNASHAVVGLLGTIPVLGMGLFAPLAAILAARVGTRHGLLLGLTLIAAFGLARTAAPGIWSLVALTCGVGLGMGIANATAPLVVRDIASERPAVGTGVYMIGIQVGSAVSAAIAVPLAALFGGWRWALVAFSAVALLVTVVWAVSTRGREAHVRPDTWLPRLPVRSPVAWLLSLIFALMGCAYYGFNAWVPDAYGERGWDSGDAGLLLSGMNATAIVASFLIPWAASRWGGTLRWMTAMSVVFSVGGIGLVALPDTAFVWALVAGVSQGGMFSLVMLFPLGLGLDRLQVGALVAMMLGLGYTTAALAPFVLGAVRDVTGSFDAVLWTCAGFLVAMIFVVRALAAVRARETVVAS